MTTNNKKAILLPEVLKIILGVVSLIFLIILAVGLYGLFIVKTEKEQATETLNQIVAKINGLEDGEEGSYLLMSPKDWVLMSNGKEICSCYWQDMRIYNSDKFNMCSEKGICRELDYEIKINRDCYSIDNCFYYSNLPVLLSLGKKNGIVSIKTAKDSVSDKVLRDILKYKRAGFSNSVEELILDYSRTLEDNERNIFRDEIKLSVEDYLEKKLDSDSLFGVKKENLGWLLNLREIDENNNVITHVRLSEDRKDSSTISLGNIPIKGVDEYEISILFMEGKPKTPDSNLPEGP